MVGITPQSASRRRPNRLDVALSSLRAALAREVGISVPELLALENLGADGGLGPSELARRLQLSTGAVTALVDRLEASGLVARAAHPSDRRRMVVTRTAKASDDSPASSPPWRARSARLVEALSGGRAPRRGTVPGRASSSSSSGRQPGPAPHDRPHAQKEHTMSSTPATDRSPATQGREVTPELERRLSRLRLWNIGVGLVLAVRGDRHRRAHQRLHAAGDGDLHDRASRHRAGAHHAVRRSAGLGRVRLHGHLGRRAVHHRLAGRLRLVQAQPAAGPQLRALDRVLLQLLAS